MNIQISRFKLTAAFAALALSAAAVATAAQEDAKAAQQRPITNSAQPASAATQQPGSEPASNSTLAQTKFDLLDANHDGKLSLTEFASINDLAAIKADRKGYQ